MTDISVAVYLADCRHTLGNNVGPQMSRSNVMGPRANQFSAHARCLDITHIRQPVNKGFSSAYGKSKLKCACAPLMGTSPKKISLGYMSLCWSLGGVKCHYHMNDAQLGPSVSESVEG